MRILEAEIACLLPTMTGHVISRWQNNWLESTLAVTVLVRDIEIAQIFENVMELVVPICAHHLLY